MNQDVVPLRLIVLAHEVFVHRAACIDSSSLALDLTFWPDSVLAPHFNVKRPTWSVATQKTRVPAPPLQARSGAHSCSFFHFNAMHVGHEIQDLRRIGIAVRESVVEIAQHEAVVVQVRELEAEIVCIQMQSLQHIDRIAIAAQHFRATLNIRTISETILSGLLQARTIRITFESDDRWHVTKANELS